MSTTVSKSPRQRERAYLRLREMLILQQIPEGTRLRETQWSQRLSVNRMALREALARLAGEGFITRGADTGYYVPMLTEKDISEIRRTRLVLECGAIHELCAAGVTPRKLAPLREACDDLEAFLRKGYQLGVVEADRRFHELLVDAAENKRLAALYRRAPLPLIRGDEDQDERWPQVAERTLHEHRAILRTLLSGNAAEAMQLLSEHLHERAFIPVLAAV